MSLTGPPLRCRFSRGEELMGLCSSRLSLEKSVERNAAADRKNYSKNYTKNDEREIYTI
ncbi:MAG: hypothetical protein ACRDYX_11985 [Egibacteraceae bacterium]